MSVCGTVRCEAKRKCDFLLRLERERLLKGNELGLILIPDCCD